MAASAKPFTAPTNAPRMGRNGHGPARYGRAISIYSDIRKESKRSTTGVLQRLALALQDPQRVVLGIGNSVFPEQPGKLPGQLLVRAHQIQERLLLRTGKGIPFSDLSSQSA